MSRSAVQPSDPRLSGLEARIREAWGVYRENLVALDGVAYDHAERAEWSNLQEELRDIAAERATVRALLEISHGQERPAA